MLDRQTLSQALGRPLCDDEDKNFDKYLDIATARLQQLLCYSLTPSTIVEARKFIPRPGYRTLFVPPFTSNSITVSLNGSTVSSNDYTIQQNDSLNGTWFNSIVMKNPIWHTHYWSADDVIQISATWGFGNNMPEDFKQLVAQAFVQAAKPIRQGAPVKSKSYEGYSVSYDVSKTAFEQFASVNATALAKYSQCYAGEVLHGPVC